MAEVINVQLTTEQMEDLCLILSEYESMVDARRPKSIASLGAIEYSDYLEEAIADLLIEKAVKASMLGIHLQDAVKDD
jgi:hypothetical protein